MRDYTIIGIHVTDRAKNAGDVQTILTEFGALVRTRLGLHTPNSEEGVGPTGLILLDVVGGDERIEALCDKLKRIHGVQVQRMFFTHPR